MIRFKTIANTDGGEFDSALENFLQSLDIEKKGEKVNSITYLVCPMPPIPRAVLMHIAHIEYEQADDLPF